MDVVYNHSGEQGPWLVGDRLAAKCYNLMCQALPQVFRATPDRRDFTNATGTGDDLDFSGGPTRFTKRLVTDSLALWHQAYGVDGFRFDLARILADGSSDAADWVDNDPRFAAAHLHAEPWDLGGQWYDFMDSHGWSAGQQSLGQVDRRLSRSDAAVLAVAAQEPRGFQAADRGLWRYRPRRRPGIEPALALGELHCRP